MIGPILVVMLLTRAAASHGHEIPCAPNTCQPTQDDRIPVYMGTHWDKHVTVRIVQPDGTVETVNPPASKRKRWRG